jgi:hypothetical protein
MSGVANDENRFVDPDEAYRLLIDAHRDLDDEASAALNARLVLVLANELGDIARLQQAIRTARTGLDET